MATSLTFPLEASAVISAYGRYRYLLVRKVGPDERTATFHRAEPVDGGHHQR